MKVTVWIEILIETGLDQGFPHMVEIFLLEALALMNAFHLETIEMVRQEDQTLEREEVMMKGFLLKTGSEWMIVEDFQGIKWIALDLEMRCHLIVRGVTA